MHAANSGNEKYELFMVFTHGDEGNFTMQENVMLDRLKSGSTTTASPFGKLRGGDSRQATTAPKPSTIELRNFRRYFDCPHIIPVRQGELPHELDRYIGYTVGRPEVRWSGFHETTDEGHRL